MAYRRSKQKASLATLEKQIKEKLAEISFYETELAKHRTELLSIPPISDIEIKIVKDTLARIGYRSADVPEPLPLGGFSRVFCETVKRGDKYYNKEMMLKHEDRMAKLAEFERTELYIRYKKHEGLDFLIKNSEALLGYRRTELLKLEKAASPMRRKKDEIIELRAATASNDKETRAIATTVIRGLSKQPWCPYCGNSLGSTPHVDHIYPVSKGGRSVPKNMVYVCSQCNIMKSNLTLAGFIRKFSLDRDIVEGRLKELYKDF